MGCHRQAVMDCDCRRCGVLDAQSCMGSRRTNSRFLARRDAVPPIGVGGRTFLHGGTPCLLLKATKVSKITEPAKKRGKKTRPQSLPLTVCLVSSCSSVYSLTPAAFLLPIAEAAYPCCVAIVTEYRDNCHGISGQLPRNIETTVTQHELPVLQWLFAHH